MRVLRFDLDSLGAASPLHFAARFDRGAGDRWSAVAE
jgi:hypothetical protein